MTIETLFMFPICLLILRVKRDLSLIFISKDRANFCYHDSYKYYLRIDIDCPRF